MLSADDSGEAVSRLSFDSFFDSPAQTRVFVRTALQSRSTGMHLQPGPVLRPDRTGLETRPHRRCRVLKINVELGTP